ncbi:hypothetical protein SEA_TUNATARTARE_212 [Streptomyces phage TunaTartare]|jgi:hypothetical protein|uniref:Uncharacterized protein n=1 Tax=Streptomyces phage TunaTartare TaxID=2848887 RepID=A0A8F2IW90_9CAUD|nr:hypothetical protein PP457_gp068 [Streptomyces phage TunaTartare]QWT30074.1 hypothetical protein SEA_TUNATARTARE_212 [Streptomyces phage TunaTartare]
MRYEVRKDPKDDTQWVIWDTVEERAYARYGNPDKPQEIVDKYYAAQRAAEYGTEQND